MTNCPSPFQKGKEKEKRRRCVARPAVGMRS